MRLQKELNKHGLHHNSIRRSLFDNFLLSIGNERHFQEYLLLCTGYIVDEEFEQRLAKILRVFEFTLMGNYSYGALFALHKDWHSFFKEMPTHVAVHLMVDVVLREKELIAL